MKMKWEAGTAPAFAKVRQGALVALSVDLPAFDKDTAKLHELDLAGRVAAGWYQVDGPAPTTTDPMPGDPPAIYELVSTDGKTGVAVLSMKQAAPKVDHATMTLRMTRDNLLAKSDRSQLADFQKKMTVDQRKAWEDYRQGLRDAPQTGVIPTAPGEL